MERNTYTLSLLTAGFLLVVQSLAQPLALQAADNPVTYVTAPDPIPYTFQYSPPSTAYLTRLREMYGLEAVIASETTDLGRARALCQWVHHRLDHDGHKQFKSQDAFAILNASMLGQQVQCVEFGLVLTAAFNAVGIPARPLYLKAADVQTRTSAAGHALTEAWLPDQGKWVMSIAKLTSSRCWAKPRSTPWNCNKQFFATMSSSRC
ncbi:transglutaminase-like domain-containing protein [Hymenobacter sp. AT01-02]|uniref:transglutaminase-like domain-containing protein n=1 Tax=Hymenobacter sp. AT01-02 TaxID=1571877 RepID=UPI0005F14477|nr:transglutaminase-like domain-containing protein [Hymenobacter sp. AT01-02]